MYRFALTYMKDEDDAKDVVQDVLLKLWETRDELNLVKNREAWCITLTRNKALDKLKRVGRKMKTELNEVKMQIVSDEISPVEATANNQEMTQIREIMSQLPEKQRSSFHLRDVEGYSYLEICETLKMDINQVKVNIFRARKTIKLNLEKLHSYGYQEK